MGAGDTSLFWYVARGSGMVAYVLLTAAVVVGIAVSKRWHGEGWPRMVVESLHRSLATTFLAFVLVHTVTILVDPFTRFGLADVAVPFFSAYRTAWLGLGIIATELAVAIAASVLVRDRIGYRAWHALHLLTYAVFPLSLLHGLGTGTDTRTTWATLVYATSFAAVAGALLWRTYAYRRWRSWVLVGSAAAGLLLIAWCALGPYAAGWAQASGT